jgi:hypothetical protein
MDIIEKTNLFIADREASTYFVDFYLNFGNNNLAIANNVMLVDADTDNATVLIKLYEPLPDVVQLKDTLWVVTAIEEPRAYNVVFEEEPIVFDDTVRAKGPNFNIDINDKIGNSTLETTLQDLLNTPQTSIQNQINSLLEEKEIDVNIDYTEYSNFIHFSSSNISCCSRSDSTTAMNINVVSTFGCPTQMLIIGISVRLTVVDKHNVQWLVVIHMTLSTVYIRVIV